MPSCTAWTTISIHVLREEDDYLFFNYIAILVKFQSTSSARRTTGVARRVVEVEVISIHVLREEDDF